VEQPLRLQPLTRHRLAAMGELGRAWVAALPELLAQLERQWSITVGRTIPGGSGSYVAMATNADGSPAVVKVAVIEEGWADQVATLERAQGRGYVRLLEADPSRRAMLLEWLGKPLGGTGWSPERQLGCLADTLALAWLDAGELRPVAGADKASQLGTFIAGAWPRLGRPVSERVVQQALHYAERRAAEATVGLVVVHGDPHPDNLLAVPHQRPGAETGYVFVDPDGFVADRAYDLGVALRDWTSLLLGSDARRIAERLCSVLAERSGVDAQRIWEWGFVERVSTGLYLMDVVRSPESISRPYLDSAERLVG
jgi:streptomycin 6-kinase